VKVVEAAVAPNVGAAPNVGTSGGHVKVVEAEEVEAFTAPVPEPNPPKDHLPAAGAPNTTDVGAAEAVAPKPVAAPVAEPNPPPAGAPNPPPNAP
jgi:hypothetical protein